MICKWHKCEKEFEPARSDQEFCSKACRIARANWRMHRGSALVDLLIDGQWTNLKAHREKLREEIKNG